MSALAKGLVSVAAIVAAAAAGLWAGQTGAIKLSPDVAKTDDHATPTGPVIYYRDPTGKPFYSLKPRTTDGGQAYVAIRASEDVSFEPKPKTAAAGMAAASSAEKKIKFYRNPMGLPDTSPVPKKDSMGMDYIPVYEGEDRDDGAIAISPEKVQRTGVETISVSKHTLARTIKAPGVVTYDERRVAVVAPRFDGYVVKVANATTGTHVKKGDALTTVFSQELLNWGARLVIEQRYGAKGENETSTAPGLKSEAGGVIGANRRLENLGASQEFIDEIKRTHRVPDMMEIRAPMDGVLLERNVVDGQAFKAGDVAFRIADHSSVWMMADIAEGDIDAVRPGQTVMVTTRAHPGRVFRGQVTVVYPHLMKETRTARVRIELPNPDLALLPDMYGDVEISTGGADVLAVPASAVIDSGSRQVVLVDVGQGRYAPRDVKLGRRGDDIVELLSGVSDGDKVVVNGNFLIDAESNLQSALKGFNTPSLATPAATEAGQ